MIISNESLWKDVELFFHVLTVRRHVLDIVFVASLFTDCNVELIKMGRYEAKAKTGMKKMQKISRIGRVSKTLLRIREIRS